MSVRDQWMERRRSATLRTKTRDSRRFPGLYIWTVFNCYDRDGAVRLMYERFKDDPDIDKVRIVRTESWKQNDAELEKDYAVFYRLDGDGTAFHRPPCPDCGEGHIISKGSMWLCRGCGRWFSKTYRKR